MLKQYTLRMPGAVFGGENSLDNLTNLVKDTAKVAVFTDKGIEATGLADLVTRAERFASRHAPGPALYDGFIMGVGFTGVLLVLGVDFLLKVTTLN